jgi:HAE1 family hydrophobic/amphiphilic exporter-1
MQRLDLELARRLEGRLSVLPGSDSVVIWSGNEEIAAEVSFRWGVEDQRARLAVVEALDGVTIDGSPISWQINNLAAGSRPTVVILATGDADLVARSVATEDLLLPAVSAIPGVFRVEILGGERLRTIVRPTPGRLIATGVTPGSIRDALRRGLHDRRLGEISDRGSRVAVMVAGVGTSPAEVSRIRVPLTGGETIALGELAKVASQPWSDHGALYVGGEKAVGLAVTVAADANALQVRRHLEKALSSLEHQTSSNLRFEKVANSLDELWQAVQRLFIAAVLGALIAGAALALFVRRLVPLILLVLVIPMSLLAALPVFLACGITLNLVSLVGMALSAGMLVDASVVVLEACLSRRGVGQVRAVDGTISVGRAIIASAFTTAVVFLPALYLQNLAAILFRQLAAALIITLLASLGFALLALPVAVARLRAHTGVREGWLQRRYRRALAPVLARPGWAAPTVVCVLAGCWLISSGMPQYLLSPESINAAEVEFVLPPQPVRFDQFEDLLPILGSLRKQAEQDVFLVRPAATRGAPLPQGTWRLPVIRTGTELETVQDALRAAVPGLAISKSGPTGGILDTLPLRPLTLEISGQDRERVRATASLVSSRLEQKRLESSTDLTPSHRVLEVRPTDQGRYLSERLGAVLRDALPNLEDVNYGEIRLDERKLSRVAPEGVMVEESQGSRVPLRSLTEFVEVQQPTVVERRRGMATVSLVLGSATADVAAVTEIVQQLEDELEGAASIELAGAAPDWYEARNDLVLAAILGLALVLLVLAAIFESMRFPVVVLAAVPFALFGGLAVQRLTGRGLDLGSGLGFIFLVGLAVNNGVLLLDRLRGCTSGPAYWSRRAARRLRPVLITTISTVLTLLPLVLLGGAGSPLRVTLAQTTLAGLVLSTVASLFVLPALGRLVLRQKEASE